MALIDKLAWIHLHEGRVLSTRSRGKDVFYLPGGKREGSETDAETLVREIREELSVELLPESLRPLGVFEAQAHGHAAGIVVRMTCYTGAYQGEISAAAEIEEVVWLEYADRLRSSPVDQLIFQWLHDRQLIR